MAKLTGHCETTVEEWCRRGIRHFKAALGIEDATWPPIFKGYRLDSSMGNIDRLVERLPERPSVKTPPVKVLTKEQVAALYGTDHVHPRYGEQMSAEGRVDRAQRERMTRRKRRRMIEIDPSMATADSDPDENASDSEALETNNSGSENR